jgi:hypothetical protein
MHTMIEAVGAELLYLPPYSPDFRFPPLARMQTDRKTL